MQSLSSIACATMTLSHVIVVKLESHYCDTCACILYLLFPCAWLWVLICFAHNRPKNQIMIPLWNLKSTTSLMVEDQILLVKDDDNTILFRNIVFCILKHLFQSRFWEYLSYSRIVIPKHENHIPEQLFQNKISTLKTYLKIGVPEYKKLYFGIGVPEEYPILE